MEISNDSEPDEDLNDGDEEWNEDDDGNGDTTDLDTDLLGSPKPITPISENFPPRKTTRHGESRRSSGDGAKVNSNSLITYVCCVPKLSVSPQIRSRRASAAKSTRSRPPRPRRLDVPPVSKGGESMVETDGEDKAFTLIYNRLKTKRTQSPAMLVASACRVKNSLALPRSSSSGVTYQRRKAAHSFQEKENGLYDRNYC